MTDLRKLDEDSLDRLVEWVARAEGVAPEGDARAQAERLAALYLIETTPIQPLPAAIARRLADRAAAGSPRAPDRPARWLSGWAMPAFCAALTALAFIVARVLPGDLDVFPRASEAPHGVVQTFAWNRGPDPAGANLAGSVTWQEQANNGFMTFTGLAANDPRRQQYQLWIIDAERDARYPVDGGVFNVPAGADTVRVPIHAHLHVGHAAAFVVTLERPGGVVVSDRGRIVAIAKRGEG